MNQAREWKNEVMVLTMDYLIKISVASRDEMEEIILMNVIMKKELRPCTTHNLYAWNQAGSRFNYGNIMDIIFRLILGFIVGTIKC